MTWTLVVLYSTWLILSLLIEDVSSSDYCTTERGLEYCQWTCCGSFKSQYCCMSPYTIAGIVFGAVALICTIVATVFCICQYKKQKGQVATTQRIFVVNGANSEYQHYGYPHATRPLAPGYNTQYGTHFNGISPPAYTTLTPQSTKKGPPPPPVHLATEPGVPPPPPPAYSPPPQYPFARAADEAFRK